MQKLFHIYCISFILFSRLISPILSQNNSQIFKNDDLAFKYNLFRETLLCISKDEGKGYSNELIIFAKNNMDNGDELTLRSLDRFTHHLDKELIDRCKVNSYYKVNFPSDKLNDNSDESCPLRADNYTMFHGMKYRSQRGLRNLR